MITVIVKCVNCGEKKEIKPGEIPADEVPMCDKCFMPMVPEKAKRNSPYPSILNKAGWGGLI